MKYYYTPQFIAAYYNVENKMYLLADTTLYSGDSATFTKGTTPRLPNQSFSVSTSGAQVNAINNTDMGYGSELIDFQGDYELTTNGAFDRAQMVYAINGKFIIATRHQIHVSTDKVTWTSYDMPSFLEDFLFIPIQGKLIPIASNYYGLPINNPVIHPDLGKRIFSMPTDFKDLNRFTDSNTWGANGAAMVGYICKNGWWHPKPVYYSSMGYANSNGWVPQTWTSAYDKVKVSNTEINIMLEFRDLNIHWDPAAYDPYTYTYHGAWATDAYMYQIVCCDAGIVMYRIFPNTSNNIYSNNTNVMPFQLLDLGTSENVIGAFQYKFTYDVDSPYQVQALNIPFEKRYIITTNTLYELNWTGTTFEASIVLSGTFGEVISTQYIYRSKWTYGGNYWGDYLTGLSEIHTMYIYCKNGKCIVIDASNRTIPPTVAVVDMGLNFVQCLYNALNSQNVFITDTNQVFVQTGNLTFQYKFTVTEEIIGIQNEGDYINICTRFGVYKYSELSGLSPKINYELFSPAITWQGYITEIFNNNLCNVGYVNGHYIVNTSQGKVYFTDDFITWTLAAYSSVNPSKTYKERWVYFNGHYVLIPGYNYGSYYLDLDNKVMVSGLDPNLPALNISQATPIILNDKIIYTNYLTGWGLYDPTNPLRGLRTPVYSRPADNNSYNNVTYTVMSRITFDVFVTKRNETPGNDSTYMTFKAIGISGGVCMSVKMTPIEGSYPYTDRTDKGVVLISPFYNDTTVFQKFDSGQYTLEDYPTTSEMKHIVITLERLSNHNTNLDLLITEIAINGVPILYDNFDQLPISYYGDSWSGISTQPIRYYDRKDPTFRAMFNMEQNVQVGYYSDDFRPVCFIYNGNDLYMLRMEYVIYEGLRIRSICKYNTITGTFDVVTNPSILAQFAKYPADMANYLMVGFKASYGCVGFTDTSVITQQNYVYKIDDIYPMAITGTKLVCTANNNSLTVGHGGRLVITNHLDRYYQSIVVDPTITLVDAIQLNCVIDGVYITRIMVIGNSGYVAYTDNFGRSWHSTQLSANNLTKVYADLSSPGIYKVVILGKNGTMYYSDNSGTSWQTLALTTNLDLTSVLKHSSTGKYVLSGDSFVAISTDLFTWNTIITGLVFSGTASIDWSGNILIGGKDGKLVHSTDLYNWSYAVSNTATDIVELVVAYYQAQYSGETSYWYIAARLAPSTIMPSDVFHVGDSFYWPNGYYYDYSGGGNGVYTEQYDAVTITSISGIYFTFDIPYTSLYYPMTYCKRLVWTDIYKKPDMKMYSDAGCTKEITSNFYYAITSSLTVTYLQWGYENQQDVQDMVFTFDTDVDVSTIQYMALWISKSISDLTHWTDPWYGTVYTQYNEVSRTYRFVTMAVTSFNTTNRTVTVSGFVPGTTKSCNISTVWPYYNKGTMFNNTNGNQSPISIGIPYNSFYAPYIEDQGKCETLTTSVWFKTTSTSKLYDSMLITSRSAYGGKDFSFAAYMNSGTLGSTIHNASIVRTNCAPEFAIRFKRPTETSTSNPFGHHLYMYTSIGINYIADTSKILFSGLVLDITNLVMLESDEQTVFMIMQGNSNGDLGTPQATADLTNKYYNPDAWTTTAPILQAASAEGIIVTTNDIKTAACTISYTPGDIADNGYVYLRAVTGDFKELQDINAELLFDSFHIGSSYVYNQNNTQIKQWAYVSPTVIKVRPFQITDQYGRIIFKPLYRAFTGILQYVKTGQTFDYSSEALQPLYSFDAGTLEFNIDQFPTIWKTAYDLPAISNTEALKVNIRLNRVVRGVKYLPFNIIRLSGVEYNL